MTIEPIKNEPPLSASTLHPASPPREIQVHTQQKPSSGEVWRHKEGGLYLVVDVFDGPFGPCVAYVKSEGFDRVYVRDLWQFEKNFTKVGK